MAESDFQKHLMAALNAPGSPIRVHRQHAGSWWASATEGGRRYRMHGGPAGVADLVGFATVDGVARYLEVECKSSTGRQRKAQQAREKMLRSKGAIYVLVAERDVEAAAAFVRKECGC